ncbi:MULTISPECIES: hypothetical protein [unclassified Pseudoalteromonas]|uniref:hypothetical protein n=1 Tax=unclassified Pseudoalteromonas TaxID=194690 RepID=UPI0005A987BD|nr:MULTISPECIES: hypothetical protein [unclassified Pseudoalteromonas]
MHPFALSKESIKKIAGANSIDTFTHSTGWAETGGRVMVPFLHQNRPPVMVDDVVFIAPLEVRFQGEIVIN